MCSENSFDSDPHFVLPLMRCLRLRGFGFRCDGRRRLTDRSRGLIIGVGRPGSLAQPQAGSHGSESHIGTECPSGLCERNDLRSTQLGALVKISQYCDAFFVSLSGVRRCRSWRRRI